MFANVWRKPDSAPWRPEDFLDPAARDRHAAEYQRSKDAALLANAQLSKITKDAPPTAEIPEWARGPYQGAA